MSDESLYKSTQTDETSSDAPKAPPRKPQVLWFVIPALVGAVLGWIFLGPTELKGHSVGAGKGGFIGLAVGILLRAVRAVIPNR